VGFSAEKEGMLNVKPCMEYIINASGRTGGGVLGASCGAGLGGWGLKLRRVCVTRKDLLRGISKKGSIVDGR
jgi:hypothetical protein